MANAGTVNIPVRVELTISVTHTTPPQGSSVMPCCGRTPYEVPHTDRMNENPARATCALIKGDVGERRQTQMSEYGDKGEQK